MNTIRQKPLALSNNNTSHLSTSSVFVCMSLCCLVGIMDRRQQWECRLLLHNSTSFEVLPFEKSLTAAEMALDQGAGLHRPAQGCQAAVHPVLTT